MHVLTQILQHCVKLRQFLLETSDSFQHFRQRLHFILHLLVFIRIMLVNSFIDCLEWCFHLKRMKHFERFQIHCSKQTLLAVALTWSSQFFLNSIIIDSSCFRFAFRSSTMLFSLSLNSSTLLSGLYVPLFLNKCKKKKTKLDKTIEIVFRWYKWGDCTRCFRILLSSLWWSNVVFRTSFVFRGWMASWFNWHFSCRYKKV